MRERTGYPPFGRLASLIISAGDRPTAEGFARKLAAIAPIDERIQVLGPAEAPLGGDQGPLPFSAAGKVAAQCRHVGISARMARCGAEDKRQSQARGRRRSAELFVNPSSPRTRGPIRRAAAVTGSAGRLIEASRFCNRRPGLWVPAPRAQVRTRQGRHGDRALSQCFPRSDPGPNPTRCDKITRRVKFRFRRRANHLYDSRHPVPKEGALAIVTERWDGMWWTRRHRARKRIAGRDKLRERSLERADERCRSVRQNRVDLTPHWSASSLRKASRPDRARRSQFFAGDGGKKARYPGVSAR